ncbi:MAG: recombinase family protein [Peptococcaceae bacterium]|nr:recombinase family protein [Peptococcaceae bacterium]
MLPEIEKSSVNAAVYIRVSTDEQADHGISIPAQKSRLVAFCQAQGWGIYGFYIDDGYSGKDLERPAITRLIEDAKLKKFNTVLVLKLDRLSRRQKDTLHLLEDIFDQYGIGLKSATEAFDTTTPFGKAALGMMAVFAQLERETIVERVKLAKKESARQGRFLGGPPPFGYRYDPANKKLVKDDLQAQVVRWIYGLYLRGQKGYQHIAGELENKGVPGPTNTRWNKNFVRKILTSPVYAGFIMHEGTLYPGKHEPVIEPDKWREVQSIIRDRGAARAAAANSTGLLSGIIWCGECGARMRVKNTWQNYPRTDPKKVIRYYVCYSQDGSARHMVRSRECKCGYKRAEDIESAVARELFRRSFDPDLLRQVIEETLVKNTGKNPARHELDKLNREINSVRKKIERWYDAFERGALDPEDLAGRIRELRDRKNKLCARCSELEVELKKEESRRANTEEILDLFRNLPLIWEEATPGERRQIVANLVKSVRVYKSNQVQVQFNI